MQEDMQPIEPLNLDKINAIANRLMHLANELLESKLSRASSSSSSAGTTGPPEGPEGDLFNELESDQNLILLAAPLLQDSNLSIEIALQWSQTLNLKLKELGIKSEYQNISIHSLEEYFERNPKDKREEPDVIDPHELMIKRLKFELSERKRFEAKKKELLQKKLKLSKENDEKKSKLDELEKTIRQIVVSAKEIQSKMANQV
ncbi:hypothetical protein H4Q26_016329 [Puccinia striiformis f. sp. tritici PST-130]|nr:hypothetical protein H4Q26_016329 [Puccinia striiformis f. sp. tritici PST-130]